MTRRFDMGAGLGSRPRLDGREIIGVPARFYRRDALGGGICGLWIGGRPVYDVNVYDADGRPLGSIGSDSNAVHEMYDVLRRVLAAEDIRA
ncbi:MAG: hypothetical protein ACXV4A_14190 [Actinomycetes bacterium]